MAKVNSISIKKITEANIPDAIDFVNRYNAEHDSVACPYTTTVFDTIIDDPTTILYGTYIEGKIVAISGITLNMECCEDFLVEKKIADKNNVRFADFAILPSMRGEHILSYSCEKLINYVKSMGCDNLLCVCGLDDITSSGVAKQLKMVMQENYDNNNRKIFVMSFSKSKA